MELLPFISDVFWDFYRGLPTDAQVTETHPDLISSDEENEPQN